MPLHHHRRSISSRRLFCLAATGSPNNNLSASNILSPFTGTVIVDLDLELHWLALLSDVPVGDL